MPHWTATEQKIMNLLEGGEPVRLRELFKCLPDDLGDMANLRRHVCNIRRKLPSDRTITCRLISQVSYYQLVTITVKPLKENRSRAVKSHSEK